MLADIISGYASTPRLKKRRRRWIVEDDRLKKWVHGVNENNHESVSYGPNVPTQRTVSENRARLMNKRSGAHSILIQAAKYHNLDARTNPDFNPSEGLGFNKGPTTDRLVLDQAGNNEVDFGLDAGAKYLLLTVVLPFFAALLVSLVICFIWKCCRNWAARRRERKEELVAKLREKQKANFERIEIVCGNVTNSQKEPSGSPSLKKQQLSDEVATKETVTKLSQPGTIQPAFDQASSGGGKMNPFDRLKSVKWSNSDQTDKEGSACGSLRHSLRYDFESSSLCVAILEARNLPAMDLCGTSDPYVKVYLSQTSSNGPSQRPTSLTCKTKIHKRTLNPTFNETFNIPIAYEELKKQTLNLIVFDYDRLLRHDQIGQITIDLGERNLSQLTQEEWSDLERGPGSCSNSQSGGQLGDICLSLRYVPTAGKLTVGVVEARNLKKMDLAGLSDPYVKLALNGEDGRRLKKKKTSIKKCTLNPHYNESFSFEVPFELVQKVQLCVTVIDYDRIGTSEPIGRIILGCDKTSGETETRHWLDMLASARRPIVQWHSLKELRGDTNAERRVVGPSGELGGKLESNLSTASGVSKN